MPARSVKFKENVVILNEDHVDKRMYIVQEGFVVLYVHYGTEEETVLGICGPNKLFGELGLLCGYPSPYTAVAYSDCKLAYFTQDLLKNFVKGYPEQALRVMYNIAVMNQLLSKNLNMLTSELAYNKKQLDALKDSIQNNSVDMSLAIESQTADILKDQALSHRELKDSIARYTARDHLKGNLGFDWLI